MISRKWLITLALGASVLTWTAFSYKDDDGDDDDWNVPEKYQKMENPYEANDESIDIGESIYAKHCKSCHGKYGEGDGPKAADLESDPGDFTMEEFQEQPDGELFYKIITGKDDMPEFRKKIPYDEDVWHVINYLRTLE